MRRKVKCGATVLFSAFLLMSSLVTSALAARLPATPSSELKNPGENGYVSLHKYATPTDVEDVYKVTLTVQGMVDPPKVAVVFVVDDSGSMSWSGTYGMYQSSMAEAADPTSGAARTGSLLRRDALKQAMLRAMDVLWGASSQYRDNIQIALVYFGGSGNTITMQEPMTTYSATSKTHFESVINSATAGSGTNIGYGMRQAYTYLSAATYADYDKYVLVLTDGDEGSTNATNSQNVAAALKAPVDAAAPVIGGLGAGLGATVWSVVLRESAAGHVAGSGWKSYSLTPATTIEAHMATIAGKLNSGWYPANPTDLYGSSTYANQTVAVNNYAANGAGTAQYYYCEYIDEAVQAFDDFAVAASGFSGNTIVTDVIGNQFSLYQYPGEPLFKTEATGTPPTGVLMPTGGTAGNAGKTVTWDLGTGLVNGITYTLTYYLKIDSASADPSLWYPTNEYAYISYSLDGDDIVVYFPEPLVNVVGEIDSKDPEPEPTATAGAETEALGNTLYNIPMYVGAFGTPLQPYTPSVTPSPAVEVEEEFLDDGTVEGYDGVVPWTGQITYTVLFIVLVCLAGGTVLLWRKRISRR